MRDVLRSLSVADVMHRGVVSCNADTPATKVALMMTAHRIHAVVVIDAADLPRLVTASEIAAALYVDELETASARDLAVAAPLLRRADTLDEALARMHEHGSTHAVAVDRAFRAVGVVSVLDLLEARHRLERDVWPKEDRWNRSCSPQTARRPRRRRRTLRSSSRRRSGASSSFVTVWEIPYTTVGLAPAPVAGDLAKLSEDDARTIASNAAACAEEAGVESRTVVLRGVTVQEICTAAERFHPRMLVVGSHGWGLVKRTLFGSVSAGLLHHAKCPVLVIRSDDAPEAANGSAQHARARR